MKFLYYLDFNKLKIMVVVIMTLSLVLTILPFYPTYLKVKFYHLLVCLIDMSG